jgi:preprotein translocase subunit SecY
MAKAGTMNPAALGDASRFSELRSRVLFLVGALIVYRIGTFIPVPGIDPAALERFFEEQSGTILSMFNMFSGGALERLSIFALGVMPYISASIIVQMAAIVFPTLNALRKEGESGRRKLTQYTRYGTVALALGQSWGAALALQNQGLAITPGLSFVFTAVVTLVTGTMFLMWLGEQITERGIGNGISMLILGSIISGLPSAIGGTLELVNTGELNPAVALILIVLVGAVTAFVCFMERGQRRIAVHYARRQQGRRLYAGQSSHLPFKINMSGVIPPIFASSLLLVPTTIAQFFGTGEGKFAEGLQTFAATLGYGQPLHLVLYAALIIFFCFFYTALVFNARETSDNLKKSGAFIPGIRPGQQTGEYIDKVLTRLTLWGAIYVAGVCLLPELLISQSRLGGSGLLLVFGGTSLLIVVVVAMDFMAQLQAHLMSHQYPGLLKQANLMGYGRGGAPQ